MTKSALDKPCGARRALRRIPDLGATKQYVNNDGMGRGRALGFSVIACKWQAFLGICVKILLNWLAWGFTACKSGRMPGPSAAVTAKMAWDATFEYLQKQEELQHA